MNVWERLMLGLGPNELMVLPEIYMKNRKLFDRIQGVAYLYKDDRYDNPPLEWNYAAEVDNFMEKGIPIIVLKKVLVVRIRLPWNRTREEWWVSHEEWDAKRNDWEIIDIWLRVRRIDEESRIFMCTAAEYEIDRDNLEVIESRYLVCWKWSSEEKSKLIEIDKDRYHTYLAE